LKKYKKENIKLGKAVQILNQVVGLMLLPYSIKKSNEIIAARLGSPLAIGRRIFYRF
jgi:glucosamine--fructose-6-phosphate aminotransferase (isomerizing)